MPVLLVPAEVVTVIGPVETFGGALAVICVSDVEENAAPTPLNATLVVPVKKRPVIFTVVPAFPTTGLKPLMYGPGPMMEKGEALLLVPAGVLTLTGPVVAPGGTKTEICVPALLALNPGALTPLNFTALTPVKWTPEMAIKSFTAPRLGERQQIYGPGPTAMKSAELKTCVPELVRILSGPVVIPLGTVAVIWVSLAMKIPLAGTLFQNSTVMGAPVNPLPVITMVSPADPASGLKSVMIGC